MRLLHEENIVETVVAERVIRSAFSYMKQAIEMHLGAATSLHQSEKIILVTGKW
jgi:hypothetical protein